MIDWAKTRAEAEAQDFTLPARYDDWGRFASLIDGYAIAEEMGLGKLSDWAWRQIHAFEQTGEWQVETVLELRLLVFFKGRQLHFFGEPEHETFKVVHSLLTAISQRTGLPYADPQAEARFAREEALWKERYPDVPQNEAETDTPLSARPPRGFALLASLCAAGVIGTNMVVGSGDVSALRITGVIALFLSLAFMFPPLRLLKTYGRVAEGGTYMNTTTVVDRGLYAIVRHPQYLGYMLLTGGFVLVTQHWLAILLGIAAITGFYLQAIVEERYCMSHLGQAYEQYQQRVPRFNVILGIIRYVKSQGGV